MYKRQLESWLREKMKTLSRHSELAKAFAYALNLSLIHILETTFVLDALEQALWARRPSGTVHHSDKGSPVSYKHLDVYKRQAIVSSTKMLPHMLNGWLLVITRVSCGGGGDG